MMKTDDKIMEAIKRRRPFEDPVLKLSTILETGDIGMYLSLCADRINEAELIDGEDVRIDFMNFPDLLLTADGVWICRDILECYVSGDIVADAFEALCREEVERASVNDIALILREMKLNGLFRTCMKSDVRIRRLVIAEIFQRSIPCKCMRMMWSLLRQATVRVKHYDLIAVCKMATDAADSEKQ